MPVKDIPKFEQQNPSISVNVLCKGDDVGLVPSYVSKDVTVVITSTSS